jgi:hypothetical protein
MTFIVRLLIALTTTVTTSVSALAQSSDGYQPSEIDWSKVEQMLNEKLDACSTQGTSRTQHLRDAFQQIQAHKGSCLMKAESSVPILNRSAVEFLGVLGTSHVNTITLQKMAIAEALRIFIVQSPSTHKDIVRRCRNLVAIVDFAVASTAQSHEQCITTIDAMLAPVLDTEGQPANICMDGCCNWELTDE